MKGYIYKITYEDKVYYGSSTQNIKDRTYEKRHFCFTKYGFDYDKSKIEILEYIDFDDEKELLKLEGKYQTENECINKYINGGYESKKEYDKIRYEKNKEKITKQVLEWRTKNKERKNKRQLELHKFKISWGGDPRNNNNLLLINPNLFL